MKKLKKVVDLIEEILTSRYRFFEETQPSKSLKNYKYFFFFFWKIQIFFKWFYFLRTNRKFIQLHLTFQSNKIELHYVKNKGQILSLLRGVTPHIPTHQMDFSLQEMNPMQNICPTYLIIHATQ